MLKQLSWPQGISNYDSHIDLCFFVGTSSIVSILCCVVPAVVYVIHYKIKYWCSAGANQALANTDDHDNYITFDYFHQIVNVMTTIFRTYQDSKCTLVRNAIFGFQGLPYKWAVIKFSRVLCQELLNEYLHHPQVFDPYHYYRWSIYYFIQWSTYLCMLW